MPTDPAPALGALDPAARSQLEALAESMDWRGLDPEMAAVIRSCLAAYDAQEARLVAVMPIVHALATWPLGCPEFIVALRDLRALMATGASGEGRE